MKASEAKKITDEVIINKFKSEYKKVITGISNESKEGKYYYSGTGTLMKQTIDKLTELGYKIEVGGRMNEVEWNITWV